MPGRTLHRTLTALLAVLAPACSSSTPEPQPAVSTPQEAVSYDRVARGAFNARAAQLAIPVFWSQDTGEDGVISPEEVAILWGLPGVRAADWVAGSSFTPRFSEAYAQIARTSTAGTSTAGLDRAEAERRQLVIKELSQGRPTLIHHDFTGESEQDREIVRHILAAAERIEKLYMIQNGSWPLREKIPADDAASRALFYRNHGPWCEAPATQGDDACKAIPGEAPRIVDVYPAELQSNEGFCDALQKKAPAEAVNDHFSKLVASEGGLAALPYSAAYREEMEAIAQHLEAAAAAVKSDDEAAFVAYLRATAQAFRDNDWTKADEAWVAMNATNSKWFLRIGPDEVYWEPCALRAGFHATFALIDKGSLEWQQKLDPVKEAMEQAIAKLAGPPYKARQVAFQLPDFIEIVVNAGDSRSAHGATIGQSLPNWGPVVEAGRGRTVAMTNFYTDPDSRRALRDQAASLFCAATLESFVDDPGPQLMSTVLHEAAHNLGPSHEYAVGGKTDDLAFGGPLAATMEELKAQTAALYFTDWLHEKGLITEEEARRAHIRDLSWAFGHISRGMYTGEGQPRTYSQLAMMQLGFLMKEKVVSWKADTTAPNGIDQGCFEVDLVKFPAAAKKMMGVVGGIKARADKRKAEALKKEFVDSKGELEKLRGVITERVLRSPKASFVYSVRVD